MPNKINDNLYDAVIKNNRAQIKDLLNNGADPFTVPPSQSSWTIEKQSTPFLRALRNNTSKIIDLMLNSAKANVEKRFDLSQRLTIAKSKNNPEPMNWLQFAIIFSSGNSLETVKQYQEKHFPHIKISDVINAKFSYEFPNGDVRSTTVGSLLFWRMSSARFSSSFHIRHGDKQAAKIFMQEWIDRIEGSTFVLQWEENVVLTACGPWHNLEFALDNGLNLNVYDHNGRKLIALAEMFVKAQYNPDLWNNDIVPNLIMENFEPYSPLREPTEDEPDVGNVGEAILRNIYGVFPIKVKYVPNYKPALNLIKAKIESKNTASVAMLTQFQQTLDVHGAQLKNHESRISNMETLLAEFTDIEYAKARTVLKDHKFYYGLFDGLHKQVEEYYRTRGNATFNVHPTLPTSQRFMAAESALYVLSIAAGMAPVPYVQIIPGLLGKFFEYTTALINENRNAAVFKLELRASSLATFVCMPIIGQAMNTYGKNPKIDANKLRDQLFASVRKQLDNLYRMNFADSHEAVAFLCLDAINGLRVKAKQEAFEPLNAINDDSFLHSFNSSHSSNDSSGRGERSTPSPKSERSAEMYVPIADMPQPKRRFGLFSACM